MIVKICFAFGLLALGIFLVTRRSFLLKIVGGACLLLWLLLGDWGGLELGRRLFTFIKHNTGTFIGIVVGIFVAIPIVGKLLGKVLGGGGQSKGSSFSSTTQPGSAKKASSRDVWVVDGKVFEDSASANLYARQFHPENPNAFISHERR